MRNLDTWGVRQGKCLQKSSVAWEFFPEDNTHPNIFSSTLGPSAAVWEIHFSEKTKYHVFRNGIKYRTCDLIGSAFIFIKSNVQKEYQEVPYFEEEGEK